MQSKKEVLAEMSVNQKGKIENADVMAVREVLAVMSVSQEGKMENMDVMAV